MSHRIAVLLLSVVLAACVSIQNPSAAQPPVEPLAPSSPALGSFDVSGWGGHPVSTEVSSLWLSRGPTAGERPQPMLMVYYRGTSGWHDRKWDISSEFGKTPPFIRLSSPGLVLSIVQDAAGSVRVQGQQVDLSVANVFLVRRIDGPMMGMLVVPIGRIRNEIPSEANPPVFILETQREIADEVNRQQ